MVRTMLSLFVLSALVGIACSEEEPVPCTYVLNGEVPNNGDPCAKENQRCGDDCEEVGALWCMNGVWVANEGGCTASGDSMETIGDGSAGSETETETTS